MYTLIASTPNHFVGVNGDAPFMSITPRPLGLATCGQSTVSTTDALVTKFCMKKIVQAHLISNHFCFTLIFSTTPPTASLRHNPRSLFNSTSHRSPHPQSRPTTSSSQLVTTMRSPCSENKQGQKSLGLLHSKLPNRPLPAFNIFFQEERKEILGRYVGSPSNQPSYANILKHLESKWRGLSPEERQTYNDAASKEKVRFANELVAWNRKQDVYNQQIKKVLKLQSSSQKATRTTSRL